MPTTGYTPSIQKVCIRCGRIHDDTLYQLCQECRDGDKLAEYFTELDELEDEK